VLLTRIASAGLPSCVTWAHGAPTGESFVTGYGAPANDLWEYVDDDRPFRALKGEGAPTEKFPQAPPPKDQANAQTVYLILFL
jgi:hypothetical protein